MHLGVLFILGIGAFCGVLGAWLSERLRIPQVVGYIVIGLLVGESGLGIVDPAHIRALAPFNLFALGVIGFLVGSELRYDTFRQYGRQFAAVVLGEGLAAFLVVGLLSGLVTWGVTADAAAAVAAGSVFGAIASATDPATTLGVLREYRAQGILTTSLIAVVALDDALALTLYGIGRSAAEVVTGGEVSVVRELLTVLRDLAGSLALGGALGWVLARLLLRIHARERALAISLGAVLLAIGISVSLALDVILATMALGLTLVNLVPRRSRDLFHLFRSLSIPVYVLFFFLVGARLGVGRMPGWLWAVVALYVLGRSGGKAAGAYLGARAARAEASVRRYAGLGLFAQGGVAVGLSIVASQRLDGVPLTAGLSLGEAIVFAVTATTLLLQLVGPPAVKLAASLAGETGRAVTEEDVVATWTVGNVMTREVAELHERTPLREVMRVFFRHEHVVHPVVDEAGRIAGVLTFEDLKDALPDEATWDWIVAADVMKPARETLRESMPLREALEAMEDQHLEEVPVTGAEGAAVLGILDIRTVRRRVQEEILRRQSGAPPEPVAA
jgi:Kef-type K+ transport system membrane component KefB/CBS domain-containing protein